METRDLPELKDASGAVVTNGVVVVLKEDCPTCGLVEPVLEQLRNDGVSLTVICQDNPAFPTSIPDVVDDRTLDQSWHHNIETVPTLLKIERGREVERTVGWSRSHWESLTGTESLGPDLPEQRPGCGSLSVDPNLADELAVRFRGNILQSKRITYSPLEDEMEAAFDRGWSDGLPVVPPTEARVLRMLDGTTRDPQEVVAVVPPDLAEATVEQIAVNAVMAGCKPEYFPVVLAAIEAACSDEFNMHGLLATTYFSGPVLIVNGPIARRIGMNDSNNALGQGNRANMTIGRALQLVVRNLGGGKPGDSKRSGIDMSALGSPGKLSFCFAEREHDSPFSPLSVARGFAEGQDTVTVFAGHGPTAIVDQISRNPESLARSFASILRTNSHPKLIIAFDAILVITPEHARVFADAGWDRDRLQAELAELLTLDADTLLRGVDGIDEGLDPKFAGAKVPKFRTGGLQIVHAGGDAGLFSAMIGGWAGGAIGSEPVTVAIAS